jgi:hypothetical protein
VASFLVEAYTPLVAGIEEIERRVREVALELSRTGSQVRYVRSIYVPEDEICFHLFDAASIDDVRLASEQARLGHQRIVEAVEGQEPSV